VPMNVHHRPISARRGSGPRHRDHAPARVAPLAPVA
jgi:hypothetical protein